jgi:hypothetical protein
VATVKAKVVAGTYYYRARAMTGNGWGPWYSRGSWVVIIGSEGWIDIPGSTIPPDEPPPPVANAGPDTTVNAGDPAWVDGSRSSDVFGNPLHYHWTAPSGIVLSDSTAIRPTFVANAEGTYKIILKVEDREVFSTPDTVAVTVKVKVVSGCGPGILWCEDWEGEDVMNNWYADAGTWQVGVPTSGPNKAHGGQKVLAALLGGNIPSGVNSRWIKMSRLVVPSADKNPRLRFWHFYSFYYSSNKGNVLIKKGSEEWKTLGTFSGHSGGIWTFVFLDLTAYADSSVQLAFQIITDNSGASWYIDDVKVEYDP